MCPAKTAMVHPVVHAILPVPGKRGETGKMGNAGGAKTVSDYMGVFSHSANHYVVYPGNTPENHPPTEACTIISKQHGVQNLGPWDPWQASD